MKSKHSATRILDSCLLQVRSVERFLRKFYLVIKLTHLEKQSNLHRYVSNYEALFVQIIDASETCINYSGVGKLSRSYLRPTENNFATDETA